MTLGQIKKVMTNDIQGRFKFENDDHSRLLNTLTYKITLNLSV